MADELMNPIPITDRLPEPNTPQGDAYVMAYEVGEHPGWVGAVYDPEHGWKYDADGVSGPEWGRESLGPITHWMPWPPAPEESPSSGLTPEEQAVVDALMRAWNALLKIPESMPADDMQKFRDAINEAERIIACRATARMYPGYWR